MLYDLGTAACYVHVQHTLQKNIPYLPYTNGILSD